MADVAEARKHVQKAVAFLVSRFGFEADVFRHLTTALENLKDDPVPEPVEEEPVPEVQPINHQVDEGVAEPETVTTMSSEPSEEAAPKPKRRRARRKSR